MFNKTQLKPLRVVKIESVSPKSDDSLMLHAPFVVVSKGHMAIPDKIIPANGETFASREFEEFARAYSFEHVISSPTYPQSNGKAEKAQIVFVDVEATFR